MYDAMSCHRGLIILLWTAGGTDYSAVDSRGDRLFCCGQPGGPIILLWTVRGIGKGTTYTFHKYEKFVILEAITSTSFLISHIQRV